MSELRSRGCRCIACSELKVCDSKLLNLVFEVGEKRKKVMKGCEFWRVKFVGTLLTRGEN